MNEAITYLAMGDLNNSQLHYDLLISEAERQVNEARQNNAQPPASLWLYMDAGAIDLQNLIDQLDNNPKSWTEAPSADLISADHASIREFAYQQMLRLKETTVVLEYTGQLPASQAVIQFEPFLFGQVTGRDEQGLISNFEASPDAHFPYGTESVTVKFRFSGPPPKQVVWKVYLNGAEDQSLRVVFNAELSSDSAWYQTFGYDYTNVFILTPGEYVIELYADSRLAQIGTFIVDD